MTRGLLADFFSSSGWLVTRNLIFFFLAVFWLAVGYWTYKDARRRIQDPWLVGMATLLGLVPPFVGAIVYMLFRPPEYLDEVRERELEIRALQSLRPPVERCPVCRSEVEPTFLVCPVCTTRLKEPCAACKAPLDPMWQVCPYCEAPVVRTPPAGMAASMESRPAAAERLAPPLESASVRSDHPRPRRRRRRSE